VREDEKVYPKESSVGFMFAVRIDCAGGADVRETWKRAGAGVERKAWIEADMSSVLGRLSLNAISSG
jgi:hypothetical protein